MNRRPLTESRAHEADAALDAALLVTLAGIAGDDGEAARLGVLDEPAVEHGRVRLVREHDRLHVVEDVGSGDAAEELEAALHTAQERAHCLAERELEVEVARVARDHHERGHPSRASGQREPEVGPVDLERRAGLEVEREERFLRRPRTQFAHAVAQDRDAAGVPDRPEPLEKALEKPRRILRLEGTLAAVKDAVGA